MTPQNKSKNRNRKPRAICRGYFATVYKGRRLVRLYQSGEPLLGRISTL